MEMVLDAQGLRLQVATADLAERLVFRIGADGGLTEEQGRALPTGGIPAETLAAITVAGVPLLVALVPLSASTGEIVAIDPATGQSFAFLDASGRATAVAVADTGAGEVVYVARADSAALDCFLRDGAGDFVRIGTADTGGEGGIATLHVAGHAGQMVLIAADTAGNLHSFTVAPGGGLVPTGVAGAATGLGINGPAAGEVVTFGGETWLIQAATGSSSISVLRIGADGGLTPTDHVIDNLATRFKSLTALDVVTLDGRVYVIAGGADGGLSLFSLLPDGTLYHHGTAFDGPAAALTSVNAIEAVAIGGKIHVYVSSEDAPGLVRITLTPGPVGLTLPGGAAAETLQGGTGDDLLSGGAGNDLIIGGAGDDILIDGSGIDTLRGGTGADVFVLVADGATDVIADFDRSRDRIDLSRWPFLRNPGQLEITPTSSGARITYEGEALEIHTLDGMPLTAAEIAALGVVNLDRFIGLEARLGAEIHGTPGNDVIQGTARADRIFGHGGSDILHGGGGDDWIDGGSHFDTIYGGAGNDTVWGGDGVDTVYLGAGNDVFHDNDQTGGYGIDWVAGGEGDDRIHGGGGNDALLGGPGNDMIEGGPGEDRLWGHAGDDRLHAGPGDDTVWGGDGADWADLGDGDDTYYESNQTGPAAADTVFGGAGNDRILTGSADDVIHGGEGGDTIFAGDDHDLVFGDDGDDEIHAGSGNDTVHGGPGRDLVYLNQGEDVFHDDAETGPSGSDRVYGHAGDDIFHSGGGNDTLWGGSGGDTFVFRLGAETDTIVDFEDGIDRIVFDIAGLTYGALAFAQSGATAIVTHPGGTIRLINTDIADLGPDDFAFL